VHAGPAEGAAQAMGAGGAQAHLPSRVSAAGGEEKCAQLEGEGRQRGCSDGSLRPRTACVPSKKGRGGNVVVWMGA